MANIDFPLLTAEQIEVKVKQVMERGAVALLYKTARVDMDVLDNIVGPEKWTCDYKEIKGNLFCGIGIAVDDDRWIWKWDCGIESGQSDGNEKKAEASDAFKRAGFRWGIGRELYSAPFTFLRVATKKNGNKYELDDKYARFEVSEIEYNERHISKLVIVNASTGAEVFRYGNTRTAQKTPPQKPVQPNLAMATAEQLAQIIHLFPTERIEAMLKHYKLRDLAELSEAQAKMIIASRKKEIEKEINQRERKLMVQEEAAYAESLNGG